MGQTRTTNTYMLYTRKGRGVARIIGPVFAYEFEKMKAKFPNPAIVRVMEETAFYAKYRENYKKHLYEFWMDKAFCYFVQSAEWTGNVYQSTSARSFYCDWFTLIETLNDAGYRVLRLDAALHADPFKVGRLVHDLMRLMLVPLIEGPLFYQEGAAVYTGTFAVRRSLANSAMNDACLS